MAPLGLNAVRYGIPLALFVAGVVVAGTTGSLAAGALFMSAATAVLLLNVLHRIGVQGDRDRDREDDARRFFDEHGRWPDEPEGSSRRSSR
jgi:fructose-1,6-bisphosphatase/inositol monophosphatase family enzyme